MEYIFYKAIPQEAKRTEVLFLSGIQIIEKLK